MQGLYKEKEKDRARWLLLLFYCLLFVGMAAAQSGEKTRNITYQCKNEKLSEALRQVERLSEYYKIQFAYEDVEKYTVSVTLKNATVQTALSKLLQDTDLSYEINDRFIQVFKSEAKNSSRLISGVILDEDGEPLIGVAIRNKENSSGTITDVSGRFQISAEKRVRLVITYIGKQTLECDAKPGDNLHFVLKDNSKLLDDVVVTGYQNIDKRHLTSSVSSVSMEDLQIPGVTNLNQMLEGKIPDLVVSNNSGELNSTPRLRIRGTSTIIGNREPLWVVDGIIVNDPVSLSPDVLNDPDYVNRIGNAISGINPQDIERVDVLKDAAATALYGTRAANGVIVITTKKGRIGKPIVSYSATATVRQRPRYTDDKINLMNSLERIAFSQKLVDIHYQYPTNMPLVGYEYLLQQAYNKQITEAEFQQEVGKLQTMNTDWFKILTHDSFSQDHNVNVSGGSDKVRYYASLGYTDEEDVTRATNRRYTATSKLDITLSNKIQLSFNTSGYLNNKTDAQSSINPINYAYNTSRAIAAFNTDGSYNFYKKYESSDAGYQSYNILNELENSYYKQMTTGFTATVNLRYSPTDWFFVNGILSASTSNADIESYWGEETYYVSQLRKSEYKETPPENSELPYGGELSKEATKNKSYTARLQANVNKYFGSEHQHYLNVALGFEANSTRYESYANTERGYYLDRGKKFISDIPSSYTTYVNWLLTNVPTITDTRTNLIAGYATASYSYKEYFTLNANARYDGSNQFGNRSNEKLLPIWSVSGMVNLKEVAKIKTSWIDLLSLKVSYGEQGNMLEGQYPELVIKKGSISSYYDELYSTTVAFANPDLNWEKTRTVNLGLESSFFNGRLMLGFEYYYKRTSDAFMNKTISDINGYDSYVVNSGLIINQGYSFNLTSTPVKTENFYWNLSASLSKVMNEMDTAPGAETYELEDFLNGTAIVKGQSVGTFYSYKFLGLSPMDGGPLFDDWEERQSELEKMDKYETYTSVLIPTGQRTPDITGSINNTFTYKNWRLNIGLYYSLGAKTRLFRLFDDFYGNYSAEMNLNRDLLKAWSKPGDEKITNIPAIMGTGSAGYYYYYSHFSDNYYYTGVPIATNAWEMYDYSDVRVVSADYIKIQSLSLTYELPKKWLDMYHLNRLAVTIGATNLYTFCNSRLKGQTPTQGGFSEVQLSDVPTYTIGLTLNF